jgi:hypothetical protein
VHTLTFALAEAAIRMTLQLKNILMVLVTAAVGLFSGWSVSAKYANESN